MLGNLLPSLEVCKLKKKKMLYSLKKDGKYPNNHQQGAKEIIVHAKYRVLCIH